MASRSERKEECFIKLSYQIMQVDIGMICCISGPPGNKGQIRTGLESESGAKIFIIHDNLESAKKSVVLFGSDSQINCAKELIENDIAMSDVGKAVAYPYGKCFCVFVPFQDRMEIPNDSVESIIGEDGSILKSIKSKSKAIIQIVSRNVKPGDTFKFTDVYLFGTTQNAINVAQSLIDNRVIQHLAKNHPLRTWESLELVKVEENKMIKWENVKVDR